MRHIPNALTIMRIILVAPICYLLYVGDYETALAVFFVAAASDAIDGVIARHFGWQSRLGSILDPLADKIMMVCSYLTLGLIGLLPAWIIALVLLRDALIVSGGVAYHYSFGRFRMEPSNISKVNTFFQSLLAFVVVSAEVYLPIEAAYLALLVYITAVTTVVSGAAYVRIWSLRALQSKRKLNVHE
ncbi:MAG: CDP-alcohol phosphatidyltransferase family protein [Gammaproteobacteria bacterium]|nr:CDP-alcohol phosphatidyltransferase family protein [Gammaproteobacteria bacterium]